MKFIHGADLHLDSPFLGLQSDDLPTKLFKIIHHSTFDSFKRIVDDAISKDVDFVLLAGDLFDANDKSIGANSFLIDQLQRLNHVDIPVFISFGNHDYFSGDVKTLGYPKNTFVFGNEVGTTTLTLADGKTVSISGFSFKNQWVKEPMIEHYPVASESNWTIGMLHGSVAGINSSEGVYAPFTVSQLKAKNYDYWALGHIHKRQSLDQEQKINYSGNIQGRHINEQGDKGYLLVGDESGSLKPTFVSTAPIVWNALTIVIKATTVIDLAETIMAKITDEHFQKINLIRIILNSSQPLNSQLSNAIRNGELLTRIQNGLKTRWEDINAWVTSIKLNTAEHKISSSIDHDFFEQAEQQVLSKDHLAGLATDFNSYPFIKDNLQEDSSISDIFDQAKQILAENVSKREDQTSDH